MTPSHNPKPKHLLIIGGRDNISLKAQKLGVRYSIIQNAGTVTEHQIKTATRCLITDFTDIEEVRILMRALHAKDPFDAVLSFAELGMHPAAVCAAEMGLPCTKEQAVVLTRDKIKMRALLMENGLSTVQYKVCKTMEDAAGFLQQMNGKSIILKPYAGAGSVGVFFVDKPEQLQGAWEWTSNATKDLILAEEFLEGTEYSVESVSKHGKHEIAMITEKLTTNAPHFIELGHQVPAPLSTLQTQQIHELVTRFLTLIGHQTGPAHTELRLTAEGPKIVESQTRIGGDQIWEMTEMVSGFDQISEFICALLDLPAPARAGRTGRGDPLFALENQRITKVEGVDEAAAAEGVVRLICTLKPEQTLGDLKWSESRQGYVLCTGENVEQAIANAERAHAMVKISAEPLTAGH